MTPSFALSDSPWHPTLVPILGLLDVRACCEWTELGSGWLHFGDILWQHTILIAQESAPPSFGEVFFSSPLPLFAGLLMIWLMTWYLPEKRRRQEEADLLASLTKNDRVVTIGGLHGIVTSAPPESDVVMLKIDEAGTTRVKVNRSAISAITAHAKGKPGIKNGSGKVPGNESESGTDEDSSD